MGAAEGSGVGKSAGTVMEARSPLVDTTPARTQPGLPAMQQNCIPGFVSSAPYDLKALARLALGNGRMGGPRPGRAH